MQQRELVSGFSELKDLLIRTNHINRGRESVKLYFTLKHKMLYMHDYDDHKKYVIICRDLAREKISDSLKPAARRLVFESLRQSSPADFLNNEFLLNGFFRS